MGGNAFPRLPMVRVERQHVRPTVEFLTQQLAIPQLTPAYVMHNLMGSAGKQSSSGDLDIALNSRAARFYGEPEVPVFDLRALATRCREVLPEGHWQGRHLNGGQLQTAWPIAGDERLGLIQVDFISGDAEWLKFSHWSPGKDVSPHKGVMISTMLGVLAKVNKDYEQWVGEQRVARIGWHFDLERGLHRKWRMQLRPHHGLTDVDADWFETHNPLAPRVPRMGYVTDPPTVLGILFRTPTVPEDTVTFEQVVRRVALCYGSHSTEIFDRYIESFVRSAGRRDLTEEQVRGIIRQSV